MGGCSIGLMASMRRKLRTESKEETNNTTITIRLTAYFTLLNWQIFQHRNSRPYKVSYELLMYLQSASRIILTESQLRIDKMVMVVDVIGGFLQDWPTVLIVQLTFSPVAVCGHWHWSYGGLSHTGALNMNDTLIIINI